MVTLTAALGDYSRNIWLKIPYVNDFERVASATTLPIVILGGDRSGGMDMAAIVKKAMESGHQVRGAMLGRNVLYPENGTPNLMSAFHRLHSLNILYIFLTDFLKHNTTIYGIAKEC